MKGVTTDFLYARSKFHLSSGLLPDLLQLTGHTHLMSAAIFLLRSSSRPGHSKGYIPDSQIAMSYLSSCKVYIWVSLMLPFVFIASDKCIRLYSPRIHKAV